VGVADNRYLHPELFGHPGAQPLGLDTPSAARFSSVASLRAQANLQSLIERKAKQARLAAQR
jgi:hypothetical protein